MAPRPPKGVPKGATEFLRSAPKGTRIRRSDQFTWEDAKDGDLLYEGDKVYSGKGGATVRSQGRETPLAANSLRQSGPRQTPTSSSSAKKSKPK